MEIHTVKESYEQCCGMGETLKGTAATRGVSDTACTKTCCGKPWVKAYMRIFKEWAQKNAKELVKMGLRDVLSAQESYYSTIAQFSFGDGRPAKAISKCRVPIVVPRGMDSRGHVSYELAFLEIEVLPGNLLLLLSLTTQSRLGIVLGLQKTTALVLPSDKGTGVPCAVPLSRSPERHLLLPLFPEDLKKMKEDVGDAQTLEKSPLVQLLSLIHI